MIGEHTDYNMGFVLPGAIDKAVYVGIKKRNDSKIILCSVDFNQTLEFNLDSFSKLKNSWTNYILGVVDQLIKGKHILGGFNMVISGNIPIGAGLSSSAALECATVYALDTVFNLKLSKLKMAQIAQKAEHEYAGVMCGIMDQFASLFGRKDHLLKLDCRSLDFEYVPLKLNNIEVVLFDTMVKHSLASSEYNIRNSQCKQGLEMIRKKHPTIESLRDVSLEMIYECVELNTLVFNRCTYVVEENIRLIAACDDLSNNDFVSLGKKMFETHDGLQKKYEVSCPELDFLISHIKKEPNVLGARMMGGGFGGCTINLIKSEHVGAISQSLKQAYDNKFERSLEVHKVVIDDGTSAIEFPKKSVI